jgi:hypothetical protein
MVAWLIGTEHEGKGISTQLENFWKEGPKSQENSAQ